MKKFFLILASCGFLTLLGIGGWQISRYWSATQESDTVYTGLETYNTMPEEKTEGDAREDETSDTQSEALSLPVVDFAALRQINPDIVGWLYCEGTPINYPVVQGEDNSYYLKHLFDGTYNANGSLFLDCMAAGDFTDTHSIIYGHHMKNGSMFSSLDGYKDQDYFEAHPTLLLITPERGYLVKLFAGYVASVDDTAWTTGFSNEIEFERWLESARAKSTFTGNVSPIATDRILTLSTCSYEFQNARFVVHGVLLEL